MRGLKLCVAVLVAGVALAGAPVVEPLAEANRLMAEGEFERALARLDASLGRAPETAEAARLQLARGQCLLALARREQAKAAFTLALQQDLSVRLPPSASPDALELLEKARDAFPGTVSVSVDGEASVRIDERLLGPAPLTTQLAAGPHVVEVFAVDGRAARQEVRVRPGRSVTLALVLGDPPSRAAATARPAVAAASGAQPSPGRASPTPSTGTAAAPRSGADTPLAPPGTRGAVAADARPGSDDAVPAPALTGDAQLRASSPAPSRRGALATVAGGVVVAAGGGVLLWQARTQYDRLVDPAKPALTGEAEAAAARTGVVLQTAGWTSLGVGATALVAGAVWFALPPEAHPTVSLGLTLQGTPTVGVAGVLP